MVEKIFEICERVLKKPKKWVSTLELNIIYNVSCRAKRDPEYAEKLKKIDTGMDGSLVDRIDKFFAEYNTGYGLDIRDSLVLYEDDDYSGGCYFTVEVYKQTDGGLIPYTATEFMPGETAVINFTLKSRDTGKLIDAAILGAVWTCDGESREITLRNVSSMTVKFTMSKPGHAFAKINVFDSNGKAMLGCDPGFAGVLFDRRKIVMETRAQEDIEEFWLSEINRLVGVDPLSDEADGYEGRVLYEFNMPKKNVHSLRKFDAEYLKLLSDAGYTPPDKETLITHDSYEVYLKAPGPCHASGYLTVPRVEKKMPIHITYDGYSAYMPMPAYAEEEIRLHCTHHGYELAKPAEGYYKILSGDGGICEDYGRLTGKPNSDYDDPHDCYMTYFWLRNLQMLRYITKKEFSGEIVGLHDRWNGEIIFSGGSMGGYQACMIPALAELMRDICGPFVIRGSYPEVPAMCNTKGCIGLTRRYVPEIDFFDPTNLAYLIKCPVRIERAALGDESCPTPDIMTYYNALTKASKKEIRVLQNSSHGYRPEESERVWYIHND